MSLLVRTGQNGANHGDQRSETRAMLGGLMVRKVVAITALLALTAACGPRVKGGQAAQELKADAAAAGLSGGSGTGGGDQGGVPTTDTTVGAAAAGPAAGGPSTTLLQGPATTPAPRAQTPRPSPATTTPAPGARGAPQ